MEMHGDGVLGMEKFIAFHVFIFDRVIEKRNSSVESKTLLMKAHSTDESVIDGRSNNSPDKRNKVPWISIVIAEERKDSRKEILVRKFYQHFLKLRPVLARFVPDRC